MEGHGLAQGIDGKYQETSSKMERNSKEKLGV